MPVLEHPLLSVPAPAARLWRYTSLAKFVALLHEASLFFASVDRLGDPYEGTVPAANATALSAGQRSRIAELRARTLVSCWHCNEDESDAFWRNYALSNEGIAIRTTTERLREALTHTPHPVYLGQVQYVDFRSERLTDEMLELPCIFKRRSFAHEHELRALIAVESLVVGRPVRVDLDTLIESIYVAPSAPDWIPFLVCELTERFGVPKPIKQSSLDIAPYV